MAIEIDETMNTYLKQFLDSEVDEIVGNTQIAEYSRSGLGKMQSRTTGVPARDEARIDV